MKQWIRYSLKISGVFLFEKIKILRKLNLKKNREIFHMTMEL